MVCFILQSHIAADLAPTLSAICQIPGQENGGHVGPQHVLLAEHQADELQPPNQLVHALGQRLLPLQPIRIRCFSDALAHLLLGHPLLHQLRESLNFSSKTFLFEHSSGRSLVPPRCTSNILCMCSPVPHCTLKLHSKSCAGARAWYDRL